MPTAGRYTVERFVIQQQDCIESALENILHKHAEFGKVIAVIYLGIFSGSKEALLTGQAQLHYQIIWDKN